MENENYEEMQQEELQALQAIYMDDYSDFTKVFFVWACSFNYCCHVIWVKSIKMVFPQLIIQYELF